MPEIASSKFSSDDVLLLVVDSASSAASGNRLNISALSGRPGEPSKRGVSSLLAFSRSNDEETPGVTSPLVGRGGGWDDRFDSGSR